jgi:ribonuclease P protein component
MASQNAASVDAVIVMERLKQRADFLAAAGGAKVHRPGFILQLRDRGDSAPARVGFTVSKKVGNAVVRNRVRRQLREIVRLSDAGRMQPGRDYVVVGRKAALDLSFQRLTADFSNALAHDPSKKDRALSRAPQ